MIPFSPLVHLVVCAAAELNLGAVLGFGGDLVSSFKIMEDQGLQFLYANNGCDDTSWCMDAVGAEVL